jgi:hypothetical protein
MDPVDALLAATALHAGFQAVVTVVVYPALAEVPGDRWAVAHAAHSRRITAVVAPVYVAAAAACLWLLLSGPYTLLLMLAITGNALAGLSTALIAAPTHFRLGREGPTPQLMRRLLVIDQVRLLAAVLALLAVLVA